MQTPEPDRHLKGAMDRAWPQLNELLARLMLMIGLSDGDVPARIPRALRIQILRLLRPAEALARRLIVLLARDMEEAALSAIHRDGPSRSGDQTWNARFPRGSTSLTMRKSSCHSSPHGERSRTIEGGPPRTTFHLFEPLCTRRPRPAPQRPIGPGPRILDLDAPYPAIPATVTDNAVLTTPILARLRGLKRVLDDPERYALRHALFLRRAEMSNALPGRLSPIRPGWPPGRRSPHTPPWLADMLAHFTSEIRRGPPGPDRACSIAPASPLPRRRALDACAL